MNHATLPKSPFAQVSLSPLQSCVESTTPLGDVLTIEHQGFQARVSLYGGHVLAFQHHGEKPIFWLTDTLQAGTKPSGKETAIRGGVPICWPWFGPHPEGKGNQHGFARTMLWQLESVKIEKDSVEVTLTLSGEQTHELYPTPYCLKQVIRFSTLKSAVFEQTLFMTNHSDESVKYTGALHSYFQVSSPDNIQINALTRAPYFDQLTKQSVQPSALPNCRGPIDRIYESAEVMTMEDIVWKRSLEISATSCQQWVLWNPGVEGAIKMADVHQSGEQQFVCLEAANTQWQTIGPHEQVSISQKVAVKSLS